MTCRHCPQWLGIVQEAEAILAEVLPADAAAHRQGLVGKAQAVVALLRETVVDWTNVLQMTCDEHSEVMAELAKENEQLRAELRRLRSVVSLEQPAALCPANEPPAIFDSRECFRAAMPPPFQAPSVPPEPQPVTISVQPPAQVVPVSIQPEWTSLATMPPAKKPEET